MGHKGTDVMIGESLQAIEKFELCPQAAVSTVINVTCNQQELHLLLYTQLYEGIKGIEGCRTQGVCNDRGLGGDTLERAVQMKIARMNETETLHKDKIYQQKYFLATTKKIYKIADLLLPHLSRPYCFHLDIFVEPIYWSTQKGL